MSEKGFIGKTLAYFNLEKDLESVDLIHETIVNDTQFRGTNLWILIFAIIIASVGLNMNSTPVIIGAMLISPLMGPINGMGYSIATYNFLLFRKALRNFGFAVLVSLAASTVYFALSPIDTAASELLARTSPSIYDVLIALFGGLAGIIALSTRKKGNVIPGVAIATALMPPLCTAGYGLASGQFSFFFGAFYLFAINTVFIAISSIVVSQVLNFPIRTEIEDKQKRKINRYITIVIVIMILPSIYFGYKLVQKEKFNENAKKYISNISVYDGNYLLNHRILPNEKTIELIYGGTNLSREQKEKIRNSATNFDLHDVKIKVEQGLSFDRSSNVKEADRLKSELSILKSDQVKKEQEIKLLNASKEFGRDLLKELKSFYPSVNSCSTSETLSFNDSTAIKVNLIIIETSSEFSISEKNKVSEWIRIRMGKPHAKILFETKYNGKTE